MKKKEITLQEFKKISKLYLKDHLSQKDISKQKKKTRNNCGKKAFK